MLNHLIIKTMAHQRQRLTPQATSLMVLLCFVWALAQVGLKYTAHDMAATLQIAVRSIGGAVLTWGFVRWRGQRLFTMAGAWRPGVVVGALFAGEFFFVGEALRYTSASHVSIFLYTAPIFAALGLHFFTPDERLQPLQWLGVLLAFVGVTISFLGRDTLTMSGASLHGLLGDGLALLGGLFWGATTVVVRGTRLKNAPATETLFYQLLGAFVILLSGAYLTGQTGVNWSWSLIGNLIFQTIAVSFASLLVWFWLLRHYLASRLGVLSFMTPLFGVLLGVLLLNEHIERSFMVGAVCVVLGIILVNGHDWFFKSTKLNLTVSVNTDNQESSSPDQSTR
ncbi:MAG TPA: DMT family transporter [Paenalcaligenes hominis]|uniref:DMT family transporter n=2 Tax=Paenalcaligenes hominis TaxID=643674 RepID=A0A9D3AAZ7_9BURK|nr:DMT family transporter [Paenalcaligenes hominis]HJH24723.1 DMT family transporter [Paenalcaligenes hominis]